MKERDDRLTWESDVSQDDWTSCLSRNERQTQGILKQEIPEIERKEKESKVSHRTWERKRLISSRKSFLATVIFPSDRCSWWETSRESCREWKESRKEPSTTTMIMMMMIATSVTGKARSSSAGRILWSVCGDYHLSHKHIFLSFSAIIIPVSLFFLFPEVTLIPIQSFRGATVDVHLLSVVTRHPHPASCVVYVWNSILVFFSHPFLFSHRNNCRGCNPFLLVLN